MDDMKAFTLRHGGKTTWLDCSRTLLPKDHPFMKIPQRFIKNKVELDDPPYLLNEDHL